MKKLFGLLVGSAFALALALPAVAQDPHGPPTKEPPPPVRNEAKLKAQKQKEAAMDKRQARLANIQAEQHRRAAARR